jgi:flagellar biosynthesis/type III secretory pathway protein FliH
VSFRSFLYENFDEASHASIGGSISSPHGALSERDPRPRTEIEIARRESFDAGRTQGFAEGRRAALEEAEVRLARDLPDLLVDLGGAAAAMERVKRACEHDALRLTDAALRQMLPIIADRGLGQEAAALVAEVIANLPAPVIEVRAAYRTREAIERHCGQLPSGVTLATDSELPEGGVRCAWANGHACFDGAKVTEAVLTTLDRCLDRIDQDPSPMHQEYAQKED